MTSERMLVVAPAGRDGELIARIASEHCDVTILPAVSHLPSELTLGADGLVMTEEALDLGAVKSLLVELRHQPPWSDMPLLILVSAGARVRRARELVEAIAERANLTVLERPVRASTLRSAVSAMLRARRRQYEVRDLIEAQREARAQAESAIAMRDEFLGIASHELRTPLTVVMGHSEALLRRARQGTINVHSVTPYLEEMHKHTKRLADLIDDLLDTSRIEQGRLLLEPVRVDLRRLVESVVARFRRGDDYSSLHTIEIDQPERRIVGIWDESRVDQILTNLVSNALKYSPGGGRVLVRVGADEQHARLDVIDEGLGIPPARMAELFQPFSRLHQDQVTVGGTGLGLYITQKLVARHLGEIHATNNEGRGATFSVVLPLLALIESGEPGESDWR